MKNYGDLGACYPPRPTASTDSTLLDLHNSSSDTQPQSLTVIKIMKMAKFTIFAFKLFIVTQEEIKSQESCCSRRELVLKR